jgi:hypothetical protein
VYHYRDSAGVDHYVNRLELVPKGVASKRVDLGGEDLNPDLAREIAENAHRAAEEVKARAAEELEARAKERAAEDAKNGIEAEPPPPPPAVLPPEARLVLIWAIAFTVVFGILWLTKGLILRRSPPLAVAFQPIRWGCGVAALLSWIVLVTLARGWIADHFAPLHSIKQAQMSVDKINREQRESERELDKALKNQ